MSSRCPSCSAAVRPGDRWCGLCLRVLTDGASNGGTDGGSNGGADGVTGADRTPVPVPGPRPAAPTETASAAAGLAPSPRLPVPRRAEQPPRPAATTPSAHWPCPGCGAEVPVALDRCPGCSTGFLAPLRGEVATSGLAATLRQQSQAKRLVLGVLAGGLASLLLVGVVALLALLL